MSDIYSNITRVRTPCVITPRRLAGIPIGGGHISINYSDLTGDGGRTRYVYYIDGKIDDRTIEYQSHDLQSGAGGGDLQKGLESLLSFLGAAAEDYRGKMRGGDLDTPDEDDSFPLDVMEWCYQHSDEIGMMQCMISELPNLIVEDGREELIKFLVFRGGQFLQLLAHDTAAWPERWSDATQFGTREAAEEFKEQFGGDEVLEVDVSSGEGVVR